MVDEAVISLPSLGFASSFAPSAGLSSFFSLVVVVEFPPAVPKIPPVAPDASITERALFSLVQVTSYNYKWSG